MDRFKKSNLVAKLFLTSSACGAQVSLWSTVIPNRRVFVTHLRLEPPINAGVIGPIVFPELSSIASHPNLIKRKQLLSGVNNFSHEVAIRTCYGSYIWYFCVYLLSYSSRNTVNCRPWGPFLESPVKCLW